MVESSQPQPQPDQKKKQKTIKQIDTLDGLVSSLISQKHFATQSNKLKQQEQGYKNKNHIEFLRNILGLGIEMHAFLRPQPLGAKNAYRHMVLTRIGTEQKQQNVQLQPVEAASILLLFQTINKGLSSNQFTDFEKREFKKYIAKIQPDLTEHYPIFYNYYIHNYAQLKEKNPNVPTIEQFQAEAQSLNKNANLKLQVKSDEALGQLTEEEQKKEDEQLEMERGAAGLAAYDTEREQQVPKGELKSNIEFVNAINSGNVGEDTIKKFALNNADLVLKLDEKSNGGTNILNSYRENLKQPTLDNQQKEAIKIAMFKYLNDIGIEQRKQSQHSADAAAIESLMTRVANHISGEINNEEESKTYQMYQSSGSNLLGSQGLSQNQYASDGAASMVLKDGRLVNAQESSLLNTQKKSAIEANQKQSQPGQSVQQIQAPQAQIGNMVKQDEVLRQQELNELKILERIQQQNKTEIEKQRYIELVLKHKDKATLQKELQQKQLTFMFKKQFVGQLKPQTKSQERKSEKVERAVQSLNITQKNFKGGSTLSQSSRKSGASAAQSSGIGSDFQSAIGSRSNQTQFDNQINQDANRYTSNQSQQHNNANSIAASSQQSSRVPLSKRAPDRSDVIQTAGYSQFASDLVAKYALTAKQILLFKETMGNAENLAFNARRIDQQSLVLPKIANTKAYKQINDRIIDDLQRKNRNVQFINEPFTDVDPTNDQIKTIPQLLEMMEGVAKYISNISGDLSMENNQIDLAVYKNKQEVFKTKIKKQENTQFQLSQGQAFKLRQCC